MWNAFWIRFVIATFGGAFAGLIVGLVAKYVFDASWNPFAVMSWGIMAGAIGLVFAHTAHPEWMRPETAASRTSQQDASES